MFNLMTVDTWTIYSTLWTGLTLGVLATLTGFALTIRHEIRRNRRYGKTPQLTAGLSVVRTQDQVFDYDQNKHIA